MQKITVEITANGYTGLTVENIERALSYYFGSERLGVSFSVTEATQQSAQADEPVECAHKRTIPNLPGFVECLDCGWTIRR